MKNIVKMLLLSLIIVGTLDGAARRRMQAQMNTQQEEVREAEEESTTCTVKKWFEEKLENKTVTIKKTIDAVCLAADFALTKDQAKNVSEHRLVEAIMGSIKLLSDWIDLDKLEKFYIPHYLTERLKKEKWYLKKKREQSVRKQKAPKLQQLVLL